MARFVVLRLDAPLMSFGAAIVDNHGRARRFMSVSALAGLLANALGYDHADAGMTQRLQERLHMAQRCDRPGHELHDYQTVDLGQEHLLNDKAWTTWGEMDKREGGLAAREGTHIRFRDYLADAIYTVVFSLAPADEYPCIDDCLAALETPARPLFIGRKPCLPAAPLLHGTIEAANPLDALRAVPRVSTRRSGAAAGEPLSAWWSAVDASDHPGPSQQLRVCDQRDWRNQIHVGERRLLYGMIDPPCPDERRDGR